MTTAPQPPLLELLIDHFRHLITEMNGDRFFIADSCHSEPDYSAKDANSSQKETPALGRGLRSDSALITWRRKRRGRSGLDERCERLLRGKCCSARGGRSARHKLWARLLELRRSDLYREEQSWLVPQKSRSPFLGLVICAPELRGERHVAAATERLYTRANPMTANNNLACAPAQV